MHSWLMYQHQLPYLEGLLPWCIVGILPFDSEPSLRHGNNFFRRDPGMRFLELHKEKLVTLPDTTCFSAALA